MYLFGSGGYTQVLRGGGDEFKIHRDTDVKPHPFFYLKFITIIGLKI